MLPALRAGPIQQLNPFTIIIVTHACTTCMSLMWASRRVVTSSSSEWISGMSSASTAMGSGVRVPVRYISNGEAGYAWEVHNLLIWVHDRKGGSKGTPMTPRR